MQMSFCTFPYRCLLLRRVVADVCYCHSYMNDTKIVESGRHDELIKLGGEYARIWTLQAQAFLP